jgi:hypothetical protein
MERPAESESSAQELPEKNEVEARDMRQQPLTAPTKPAAPN